METKYRIENGSITMPVEEFNRINDLIAVAEAQSKETEKAIACNTVCIAYSSGNHWIPISEAMKRLKNEKEQAECIIKNREDELCETVKKLYSVKQMTILQFIKWRKK